MNVKEINRALAAGVVDEHGVLPHAEQLRRVPFVFTFEFGLDALPEEPGVILVRGPRQYGKSTWLEQHIRETVVKHGPGTAYYLNGDAILDADALYEEIRDLLPLYHAHARVRRLFIDEITAVADWQKAVERLADEGVLRDVLVVTTGSKAVDLRRGSERLPGRKGRPRRTSYYFTPVSFAEFSRVCRESLDGDPVIGYLLTGGSPVACAEIADTGSIPEYVHEMTRDWILGECAAAGRSRASLLAVFQALHRFGGSALGQAKLAREAGLANNTVASGYIELLSDLMCVGQCPAWDESRRITLARRPCKYPFTNLLAASAWSSERPRSLLDFGRIDPEAQGQWFEWLVSQELWRKRCIRGEEVPESVPYWQGREHGIDFVLDPRHFLKVKRGRSSPLDFAWFARTFPDSHLTVVGESRYKTDHIEGVAFHEFLSMTTNRDSSASGTT